MSKNLFKRIGDSKPFIFIPFISSVLLYTFLFFLIFILSGVLSGGCVGDYIIGKIFAIVISFLVALFPLLLAIWGLINIVGFNMEERRYLVFLGGGIPALLFGLVWGGVLIFILGAIF